MDFIFFNGNVGVDDDDEEDVGVNVDDDVNVINFFIIILFSFSLFLSRYYFNSTNVLSMNRKHFDENQTILIFRLTFLVVSNSNLLAEQLENFN